MNGKGGRASLILAALGILVAVVAVGTMLLSQPRVYRLAYEPVMGSGFHATAVFARANSRKAKAALAAALQAALDCEKRISKYDPESEVRRAWAMQPGEAVPVSEDTFHALDLSKDLWRRSGGAFDCTVEPLIELYKFTGREERSPTDAEIAAARAKVGSDKLVLDPAKRTAALAAPGMKFDLGAVGQGLGADVACETIRKAGASGALVELGGEVRALGHRPDGAPWKVAVVNPRAPERTMAVMELDGNAVSTSGDYQKFFKQGGKKASHILDPRTGRPLVGGAVSVTVIAPDCALADGLATALSVLGPVEGLKLVESYRAEGKAVEALIVEETSDGRLVPHLSPGLEGRLKIDLTQAPAARD